jgi:hypothetical protein
VAQKEKPNDCPRAVTVPYILVFLNKKDRDEARMHLPFIPALRGNSFLSLSGLRST